MPEILHGRSAAAAVLLAGALLLSSCVEQYGSGAVLRGDDPVRLEDWPDPTRDPTEERPVQPGPRTAP